MPEVIQSPLAEAHRQLGATLGEYHGARVPSRFGDARTEHLAARRAAGVFDFSFRTKLAVKGPDRTSFLHNMLSNDVKRLTQGEGTYATLLDIKGHILADPRVYCADDVLIVDTDVDLAEKVRQHLDRFILMDEVEIEPLPLFAMAIQGPMSRQWLETVLRFRVPLPDEYCHATTNVAEAAVRVVRTTWTGDEGYEVWADAQALGALWRAALLAAPATGMRPCGTEALETLRIEAGIPRYGADLDENTLPLEAGLLNALSFTKGCYPGQEIVERARSRGHVNWKLAGLVVDAEAPPAPGEKLALEGKHVGEVTSAGFCPSLGWILALAYLRREAAAPGTKLTLASGARAEVHELPFWPIRNSTSHETPPP
jgi:glycine cleavage system T protein